ncbi:metallophosphoesterase family protein [Lactobacillus sp. PV034]|uniref:metallophosphoesterase family protein n=1 Tax=Lactobacillus sp. PV034 TaxID=2594495 RepID=UPI00223EACCF|nr:DNA repair exonuclease [Lactobacillus sp. PV034]QNQ80100.1 DNA repair exonuclease [Lactobacillus sp. PV034]
MKFIHLADAHLDSPFLGLSFLPSNQFEKIKNSTQISFKKIVDQAIDKQVDLVLIAGDTFDSIHPSPQSQIFLNAQLQRLVDQKIQVVMILGNHDYLNPRELLLPQSPYFTLLGPKQEVESVDFVTKSGFPYRVVGFSYQENHIENDKIPEFPEKTDQTFTFGLMHAGEKTNSKENDNYAPFMTNEIKSLNYDYFALGHIHLRQTLSQSPLVVYSGNIQGRHINESGAKGCYYGVIDEETRAIELEFIPTAPIVWSKVKITLDQKIGQSELLSLIQLQLALQAKQDTLFAVEILGAQFLSAEEIEFIRDADSWEQISAQLPYSSRLVKVYLKDTEILKLNESDKQAFEQAKEEILSQASIKKLGKTLAKKDIALQELFDNEDFIKETQELAKVKLGRELKGFDNEIK